MPSMVDESADKVLGQRSGMNRRKSRLNMYPGLTDDDTVGNPQPQEDTLVDIPVVTSLGQSKAKFEVDTFKQHGREFGNPITLCEIEGCTNETVFRCESSICFSKQGCRRFICEIHDEKRNIQTGCLLRCARSERLCTDDAAKVLSTRSSCVCWMVVILLCSMLVPIIMYIVTIEGDSE